MEFLKLSEEIKYLQRKYLIIKELESLVVNDGFISIDPVFFEDYDSFIKINKRIKKESMVKVLNIDGNILTLRPDATTCIIKQVIPKWEDCMKLKLFYNTAVFNNNSSINVNNQFGIEYLGEESKLADMEVMKLVIKILKYFNKQFIVEVGNSKFLNSLFNSLNLNENDEQELKEYIYYKNQYAIEQFLNRVEVSIYKPIILSLLSLQGDIDEIVKELNKFELTSEMICSIEELRTLKESLNDDNLSNYLKFDLTMLSKFDYYEGLTFKGYYPNTPRPILNGGRYDSLTRRFGKQVPAIGFSINSQDFMKEVIRYDE